jgi:CRP/FNR family transcriptional regulator, cyclic AMP receptor protein
MRTVLFLFGHLIDEDADWLANIGTVEKVNAGEILIEEHKHIENVFIVLEGILGVYRSKSWFAIAKLQSGDVVGEMSFIDATPPSATVRADQSSLVLRIPRTALQTRIDEDQRFAARFYRSMAMFLSDRLRSTMLKLAQLQGEEPDGDGLTEDELDPNVLDIVSFAGNRFDRMLKKLKRA